MRRWSVAVVLGCAAPTVCARFYAEDPSAAAGSDTAVDAGASDRVDHRRSGGGDERRQRRSLQEAWALADIADLELEARLDANGGSAVELTRSWLEICLGR